MTLANCRSRLKSRLESIQGLKGHPYPPNVMPELPCAFPELSATILTDAGNRTSWMFKVILLLSEREASKGYEELDQYIDKSGNDRSIKTALEAGAVGDFVLVRSIDRAGLIEYRGREFYGAEFTVEVGDTGD
jgi:hypothetical protein